MAESEISPGDFITLINFIINPQSDQEEVISNINVLLNFQNFPVLFLSYWCDQLSEPHNPIAIHAFAKYLTKNTQIGKYKLYPYAEYAEAVFNMRDNSHMDEIACIMRYREDYAEYMQSVAEETEARFQQISEETLEDFLFCLTKFLFLVGSHINDLSYCVKMQGYVSFIFEQKIYETSPSSKTVLDAACESIKSITSSALHNEEGLREQFRDFCVFVLQQASNITEATPTNILSVFSLCNNYLYQYIKTLDEKDATDFVREVFFPLIAELIAAVTKLFFWEGIDLLQWSLRYINGVFHLLSFSEEEQAMIVNICLACSHANINEDDLENIEYVYERIFDDKFDIDENDLRGESSILFYSLVDEIGTTAFEALYAIGEQNLEENIDSILFLIYSYLQITLNKNKFSLELSQEEESLVGELLGKAFSYGGDDNAIIYLHKTAILTTKPLLKVADEFPTDKFEDPTFGQVFFSAFVKLISNSLYAGMGDFVNEEVLGEIVEKREALLGSEFPTAMANYGHVAPEICTGCIQFVFGELLNKFTQEVVSTPRKSYDEEEMDNKLENICNLEEECIELINMSEFGEIIIALINDIVEKTEDHYNIAKFISYIGLNEENYPFVFEVFSQALQNSGYTYFTYDIFIKSVVEFEKFAEKYEEEFEPGKTYGAGLIVNIIENMERLNSIDLEAVTLMTIRIIQTQEVDGDLINGVLEQLLQKVANGSDIYPSFALSLYLSALILIGFTEFSNEALDVIFLLGSEGLFFTNYTRALVGSALASIGEGGYRCEEMNALGMALLKNEIEQHPEKAKELEYSYPPCQTIVNLNPNFVVEEE